PATSVVSDSYFASVTPHFAAMLATSLHGDLGDDNEFVEPDYTSIMMNAVHTEREFRPRLAALRKTWSRQLIEIVVNDVNRTITIRDAKRLQTDLAEASVAAALAIVKNELATRYSTTINELPLAILALGKFGGRGLDYESDLDLLLVYDDGPPVPDGVT